MNNFWEIIKSIYNKKKLQIDEYISNAGLIKCLARDKNNLLWLKKCLGYEFYLEGEFYYYLLYCNAPKNFNIPYLKKIEKTELKEHKVLNEIKDFFGWSNKEYQYNKNILEKIIFKQEKYWKDQMGIK